MTRAEIKKMALSSFLAIMPSTVSVALTAVAVAIPVKTQTVDYRGVQSSLYVSLQRRSPAYAALEDARQIMLEVENSSTDLGAQEIVAGKPGMHISILNKVRPEPQDSDEKFRPLKGMIVSQTSRPLEGLTLASVAKQPELVVAGPSKPVLIDSTGDLIPIAERKALLANYYQQLDWKAETVAEKAKRLVSKELETVSGADRGERVLLATDLDGGTSSILVTKNQPTKSKPAKSRTPKNREKVVNDKRNPGSTKVAEHRVGGDSSGIDNAGDPPQDPAVMGLTPNELNNLVLSGKIALTGGIAVTGEQTHLQIAHVLEGEIQDEAKVWLDEARFEIVIDQLRGHLVAELINDEGQVIGEGEVDLYRLPQVPYNQMAIEGLELKLRPIPVGIVVDVDSARSFENHPVEVEGARVFVDAIDREVAASEDGSYIDEQVNSNSSFLYRAVAKNHWGSIALGLGGDINRVQLFPNKMVDALTGILGLKADEVKQNGVIWGRVLVDGRPVAGAEVQMAGDSGGRPIYFNGWMPDHRANMTGSNGAFVIFNVTAGVQAVRARYNGKDLPIEVIPTSEGEVSYLEIKSSPSRAATVSVFNAADYTQFLPAVINVVGTESYVDVGEGQNEAIEFPGGSGLMFIDADAGNDFELLRVAVNRKSRHVKFPMVPTEWLDKIKAENKINITPGTGVFVGFNHYGSFEVHLENELNQQPHKTIYFDSDGKVVKGNSGVNGGGFIIFNVPTGFRTVTIVPEVGLLQTFVTVSDENYTNLVSY